MDCRYNASEVEQEHAEHVFLQRQMESEAFFLAKHLLNSELPIYQVKKAFKKCENIDYALFKALAFHVRMKMFDNYNETGRVRVDEFARLIMRYSLDIAGEYEK